MELSVLFHFKFLIFFVKKLNWNFNLKVSEWFCKILQRESPKSSCLWLATRSVADEKLILKIMLLFGGRQTSPDVYTTFFRCFSSPLGVVLSSWSQDETGRGKNSFRISQAAAGFSSPLSFCIRFLLARRKKCSKAGDGSNNSEQQHRGKWNTEKVLSNDFLFLIFHYFNVLLRIHGEMFCDLMGNFFARLIRSKAWVSEAKKSFLARLVISNQKFRSDYTGWCRCIHCKSEMKMTDVEWMKFCVPTSLSLLLDMI